MYKIRLIISVYTIGIYKYIFLYFKTKCAIYSKTVKRLKKVSKLIEKMMGLKKILVLTVFGNFFKDVDIILQEIKLMWN